MSSITIRKKVLEVLVWITCLTALAFITRQYRTELKEQETFEILKSKLVDELGYNYRAIVYFELNQWQPIAKIIDSNEDNGALQITKDQFKRINKEVYSKFFPLHPLQTNAWEALKKTQYINYLDFRSIQRLDDCYNYFDDREQFITKYHLNAGKIALIKDSIMIDQAYESANFWYKELKTDSYIVSKPLIHIEDILKLLGDSGEYIKPYREEYFEKVLEK